MINLAAEPINHIIQGNCNALLIYIVTRRKKFHNFSCPLDLIPVSVSLNYFKAIHLRLYYNVKIQVEIKTRVLYMFARVSQKTISEKNEKKKDFSSGFGYWLFFVFIETVEKRYY